MWVGAWLFRFSTDSEANMSISKRHILIYKDGKWQPESPGSDSEAEAVQEACQQWDKIASAAGYTGAENILDLDYSATQNKALFTPSHLDEKSDVTPRAKIIGAATYLDELTQRMWVEPYYNNDLSKYHPGAKNNFRGWWHGKIKNNNKKSDKKYKFSFRRSLHRHVHSPTVGPVFSTLQEGILISTVFILTFQKELKRHWPALIKNRAFRCLIEGLHEFKDEQVMKLSGTGRVLAAEEKFFQENPELFPARRQPHQPCCTFDECGDHAPWDAGDVQDDEIAGLVAELRLGNDLEQERKKVRDFEEEFGVPYFTQE